MENSNECKNDLMDHPLETPTKYQNLENQLKKDGVFSAIKTLKNSLVRLTKRFDGDHLEDIIELIIKDKIFAYVRCTESQPLSTSSEKCPAEWHAITACQASVIFSHPTHKIELFHKAAFGIHDIWVNRDEANKLVTPPKQEKATDEEIYSIPPTSDEIDSLKEKIENETKKSRDQRIKELTSYLLKKLKQLYPKNNISREKVITEIVYRFELIAYRELKLIPSLSTKASYVRIERKERNTK